MRGRHRSSDSLERGQGYRGQVTLRSPAGELVTIELPGRRMRRDGNVEPRRDDLSRRQDRQFQRLLSAGYKVVSDKRPTESPAEAGEEQKKHTSLVIGTTQTGSASHGGKHASREVEDSPNAAKGGKQSRGCRGGQKKRDKDRRLGQKKQQRIQVQRSAQSGSGSVYSPQPLKVTREILASAESSAALLGELVGRSATKVRRGIKVDVDRLLIALEIGDNPLPALEAPHERPKLRILATPDCSGSTQNWNGLGQAWALHLAKLPNVDVIYATNFNGQFWETNYDSASLELVASVDVVLYLGDCDGRQMCETYASLGATVLALDSHSASVAQPRLTEVQNLGNGTLYWVDQVSAKEPTSWAKAVEVCLRHS